MSFRQVFALSALLGAVAAQAAESPAEAAPTATPEAAQVQPTTAGVAIKPGDPAAGQSKTAACGACHGMDGNSPSSQYPKLAGQHEEYIARQVAMFKTHKRDSAVMMGFVTTITDQDTRDIGAYFASKASLPGVADSKLVARGQVLYRGGDKDSGQPACMACHGPDGRGNPGAGYPQLAGQYADYLTAKLKDWRDGKTWGDDDRAKIMPAVVKHLSDADIAALASYLEGLHSADASSTAAR